MVINVFTLLLNLIQIR